MQDILELDANGLRRFGFTTGGIVAGLFGLVLPWLFGFALPIWPWIVGAVLGAWAGAAPGSLRPVYRAWMRIGLLLNRVTTPVILGVVYFAIITPMSLVMRIVGRDTMARRFDNAANSYRLPSKRSPKEKLEKPF